MLNRARRVFSAPIIHREPGQAPVLQVEGACHNLDRGVFPAPGRQNTDGQDGDDEKHQRCSRQKPFHSTDVKPQQRDMAGYPQLAEKRAGDQIARYDEENIDAHKSTGDRAGPDMGQENGKDGNGPEALYVGTDWVRPDGLGVEDVPPSRVPMGTQGNFCHAPPSSPRPDVGRLHDKSCRTRVPSLGYTR